MSGILETSNVKMTTPICDFVGQYQESDTVRFHMPGHKGMPHLGMEALDITEVKGADALYEADGIIAESEANVGHIFGTARTVYSTEGSSQCVKAMIHLVSGLAGGKAVILAARNVHKAFIYGAALADCDVEWLYAANNKNICECVISARELEDKLLDMKEEDRLPVAVYITSPDYLGNVQDIKALADVCHSFGVMLIVDNAHGAYLHFVGDGCHPMDLGADMCCDSAHKTFPVLTGGAYLHISNNAIAKEYLVDNVKSVMAIYGSTSPSYLILQSLDMCNKYLVSGYKARLEKCTQKLDELRTKLDKYVVKTDDLLKITLHMPGVSGQKLADILRSLGGECEFADKDYMVLMITPDSDMSKLDIVQKAVSEAEKLLTGECISSVGDNYEVYYHKAVMTIREAVFSNHEIIDVTEAEGRICAAPTVSCPPAVPIVISGERIEASDIEVFKAYGINKVDVVK